MKNVYVSLLTFSLVCSADLNAGLRNGLPEISIDLYKHVSDSQGVLQPGLLASLSVGNLVKFTRADGFQYSGKITEIEETPESLKLYGECDDNNTNFGFAMIKGGIFAGAVINKKDSEVYTLEFSQAHKGYILLKNYKHSKTPKISI